MEAAEALGIPDDPATWRMARLLVDHALDWGWDEVHGGFYDKGESFGGDGVRSEQGLVDRGRGVERPLDVAPEIRGRPPIVTGRHS